MDISTLFQELKKEISADFAGSEWKTQEYSDDFFGEVRSNYWEPEREQEFLSEHLGDGRFLDLGCGDFRLSRELIHSGNGVGLDLSFHALRENVVPCVCGDYRNLPFQSRCFDLVLLAFGQICFLQPEELLSLLKQCRSLLIRGGKVILDLPTLALMQELDGVNEWVQKEDRFQFYVRQYQADEQCFHQRLLELDKEGRLCRDICFTYRGYGYSELLTLIEQAGYLACYCAEDLNGTRIQEESPWMSFVLKKS
jgi:SAM-dependent methyltransferase